MSKNEIKNVDLKQCIWTIIFSLVALCIVLIPITFGEAGLLSAYATLPLIGDGSIISGYGMAITGFEAVTKLDTGIVELIAIVMEYCLYAYFAILIANIVFCIILFITRSEIMRLIFKIISIIAGFIMLLNAFACIAYIIGIAGIFIQALVPMENVMQVLEVSGILFIIGMMIFSFLLIKKQFRWFAKLY